mgnify:CR=1 FL=1
MKIKSIRNFSKKLIPSYTKKFLIPMLTTTSKNTKYYDPTPPGKIKMGYIASRILQFHQFLSICNSLGISRNKKKILDLGSGNGLVSKLLCRYSGAKEVTAADPFFVNENVSSKQQTLTNKEYEKIIKFIENNNKKNLQFKSYKKYITETAENYSFIPTDVSLEKNKKREPIYKKVDAREISKLNKKFDIIYCKALEHIPDWKKVFVELAKISKKGTYIYFKHRSFFSYLGPHRIATLPYPWAHLLLNENEYKKFVKVNFPERYENIINAYYNGLGYPRVTFSELIKFANQNGLNLVANQIETPSFISEISKYPNHIKDFWKTVQKKNPTLSSEEIFSSVYHIVLKKYN